MLNMMNEITKAFNEFNDTLDEQLWFPEEGNEKLEKVGNDAFGVLKNKLQKIIICYGYFFIIQTLKRINDHDSRIAIQYFRICRK